MVSTSRPHHHANAHAAVMQQLAQAGLGTPTMITRHQLLVVDARVPYTSHNRPCPTTGCWACRRAPGSGWRFVLTTPSTEAYATSYGFPQAGRVVPLTGTVRF